MVNTLQGNGYIYGQEEEEEEAYHGPHNIEGNYNNIDNIGRRRIEIKGIEVEDRKKKNPWIYLLCYLMLSYVYLEHMALSVILINLIQFANTPTPSDFSLKFSTPNCSLF